MQKLARITAAIAIGLFLASRFSGEAAGGAVVDLEDFPLSPDSFDNGHPDGEGVAGAGSLGSGSTYDGSHPSGGASLKYAGGVDGQFGFFFWNGWAISNVQDTVTPDFSNQYAAFAGGGAGGSSQYAVGFGGAAAAPPAIVLPADATLSTIDVTNTTYAALSMRDGDSFALPFGGISGNDPDQFKLTISGNNGTGSVEFLLADYSFVDNAQDYIVDQWETVDISQLDGASELSFEVATTVIGMFGPTTPLYFAVDNLVVSAVPEPTTAVHLALAILLGQQTFVPLLWRRRR